MSIIWSLVWGVLVCSTIVITTKYYVPQLSERVRASASGPSSNCEERKEQERTQSEEKKVVLSEGYEYNSNILNKKNLLILLAAAVFSLWCGYTASEHSVSVLGLVKMTLAMCVLSCCFITDMELMIIPNLCSVVLISGRMITIAAEFIWLRDEAAVWALNSLIASAVSLLLLLVMAKVTHGGIGMGDVKLFSSLGFLCGIRAVCFTLMFAFLLCAFVSTVMLVNKKKHLKDSLPLGPFIWLGYGVTVLLSII